jgi:hypothetical protein
MKHSEHTFETYMYNHCNMCNILIYFCNMKMKHLQHPDETSEILEIYLCNMGFQRNVILLFGRMEACRCGARRRQMELSRAPTAWATRRWDCFTRSSPPLLLAEAAVACQIGGGGRGEHDCAVEVATRDGAARWSAAAASTGTVSMAAQWRQVRAVGAGYVLEVGDGDFIFRLGVDERRRVASGETRPAARTPRWNHYRFILVEFEV